MICKYCNHNNKSGSKFCNECGANMTEDVAEVVLKEKKTHTDKTLPNKIKLVTDIVKLALLGLAILFTALSFAFENISMTLIVFSTVFYILLFLVWISTKVYFMHLEIKSSNLEDSDKSRIVCLCLCIVLGIFGAHRFYCGKIGTGFAWLFTLGGLGVCWIIDIVMICCKTFTDKDDRVVKHW